MRRSLLLALLATALTACTSVTVKAPTDRSEARKNNLESYIGHRAVKLVAKRGGSGSGVILKSSQLGSIIMTNMHVCKPLQVDTGYVIYKNRPIKISHYKISKSHDICLVRVREDLGVTTKIAKRSPKKYETLYSAGHPNGQPLTIASGTMTNRILIEIMYGYVPCDKKDESFDCILYGSKADVREMDSQYVSSLSAPGSSGSGVFNSNGEVVGLIFAGLGGVLSYSYNVPYEYIVEFLKYEIKNLKWEKHIRYYTQGSKRTKFLSTPKILGVIR